MTLLDHSKVSTALEAYPHIASQLPSQWLEKCARRGQIADAHRVYRLLAAGGVGWAGEQLDDLESLVGRIAGRDPVIDRKLTELWVARESRIDSLATELLLADTLLAAGHSLKSEPLIGTSRPEFLVDDLVLVEAKTYSPSEPPIARLKFDITHKVDSGCGLELTALDGRLTANDVGPLVKQFARVFDRARALSPGIEHVARHADVSVTLKVSYVVPTEVPEGSYLSTTAPLPDPEEAAEDFEDWLFGSVKEAAIQMKDYAGPKVVVLDVSLCRSITDAMALAHTLSKSLRDKAREKYPAIVTVIAQRQANFGRIQFEPPLASVFAKINEI